MDVSLRNLEIIEKISRYCAEIDEAHKAFHKSYDMFVSNSVYRRVSLAAIADLPSVYGGAEVKGKQVRILYSGERAGS